MQGISLMILTTHAVNWSKILMFLPLSLLPYVEVDMYGDETEPRDGSLEHRRSRDSWCSIWTLMDWKWHKKGIVSYSIHIYSLIKTKCEFHFD